MIGFTKKAEYYRTIDMLEEIFKKNMMEILKQKGLKK